jgi:hypothetical protein
MIISSILASDLLYSVGRLHLSPFKLTRDGKMKMKMCQKNISIVAGFAAIVLFFVGATGNLFVLLNFIKPYFSDPISVILYSSGMIGLSCLIIKFLRDASKWFSTGLRTKIS